MISVLRLACVCAMLAARATYAQTTAATATADIPDSTAQSVVTTFAIRSGKIALTTAASQAPAYLPDGAYTNESNTVIVILEGVVARIQTSSGQITEIGSVRMNRQRMITLTPSTNALMQVSDIRIPSGTFTSEDGRISITFVQGRPTAFTLPRSSP